MPRIRTAPHLSHYARWNAALLLDFFPTAHASSGDTAPFLPSALLALCAGLTLTIAHCLHRVWRQTSRLRQTEHEIAALRHELEIMRAREQAAQTNAQRFRSLTTLSSDWYWEQDAELRFTMRTSWLSGGLSLPRSDFIGRRRWELPGVVGNPDWEAHRSLLEKHWPFRGFEYSIRQGEEVRWISINGEPMYDEKGSFIGYRGTGRDITWRKRTEEALRASEERFNEIVSSMPVALFIKDAGSRIILMNRECERQWGVPFSALKHTDGSHIFSPDQMTEFLSEDQKVIAHGAAMDSVLRIRGVATGETLIVRSIKKAVFDADGKLRYIIGITQDITEQKRTEELLRHSREALRELGRHQTNVKEEERKRIARDIHDELGQNLMALRLDVTTLLLEGASDREQLQRRATLMMETVDRTIRSVRQIINDLRPSVLDLGLVPALEWQVEEFTKRYGLSCELDIKVDDRTLGLDDRCATTLFRVLQESLSNVQRHAEASAVLVVLSHANSMLCLSVSDNGKGGINLEQHNARGFGLLGMRERLYMLDGSFTVEELPEGGTCVCAALPLPASAEAAAETGDN